MFFLAEEKKKSIIWIIIAVLLVAVIVILPATGIGTETGNRVKDKVSRNEWGEGALEENMKISIPELSTEYSWQLNLSEREFTQKEAADYIAAAKDEIKESFLKEGENPDAVYSDVHPADTYQNGKVEAEWKFDDRTYITSGGEILLDGLGEEGVILNASVHLSCGGAESIYEFAFHLYQNPRSFEEAVKIEVDRQIAAQDKSAKEVYLPGRVSEYTLVWEEKKNPIWLKSILFAILIGIVLFIWKKQKEQDTVEKRRGQMMIDYPDFVSKLSLLLGAGMTISAALKKMDEAYHKQVETHKKKRPVYEELSVTIREIENGLGEYKAYSDFGERCGLWQYRRLCALITQSQRMGNRKLMSQLNEEAKQAFSERKNLAKKLGEEAGTKLLFPMMLMMLLIMGLVLIPAYLTLQM